MTKTKEIVETIPGLLSLSECRESIAFHGDKVNNDISSTLVNSSRILTLRRLLDLFEQYNNKIIKKKEGPKTYIIYWRDGAKEKVRGNNVTEAENNSIHRKENPNEDIDFFGYPHIKSYKYNSHERKWDGI